MPRPAASAASSHGHIGGPELIGMLADSGGGSGTVLGCEPSIDGASALPPGDETSSSGDGSDTVTDEDGARAARSGELRGGDCTAADAESRVRIDVVGRAGVGAMRSDVAGVVVCDPCDGDGTVGGGGLRVPCSFKLKSRNSLGPIVSFDVGAG